MAAATPLRLAELSGALNANAPILFSCAAIRWLVGASAACLCTPWLPTRLRMVMARAHLWVLSLGSLYVIRLVAISPPRLTDVCAGYTDQHAQGAAALLAVVVLLSSDRMVASALALSALKAVGDLVSAAVPLSLCSAYAACYAQLDTLTLLTLSVYTLSHAVCCHDDARYEDTHATVLATISLYGHFCARLCAACCCYPLRALGRSKARRRSPPRGRRAR